MIPSLADHAQNVVPLLLGHFTTRPIPGKLAHADVLRAGNRELDLGRAEDAGVRIAPPGELTAVEIAGAQWEKVELVEAAEVDEIGESPETQCILHLLAGDVDIALELGDEIRNLFFREINDEIDVVGCAPDTVRVL